MDHGRRNGGMCSDDGAGYDRDQLLELRREQEGREIEVCKVCKVTERDDDGDRERPLAELEAISAKSAELAAENERLAGKLADARNGIGTGGLPGKPLRNPTLNEIRIGQRLHIANHSATAAMIASREQASRGPSQTQGRRKTLANRPARWASVTIRRFPCGRAPRRSTRSGSGIQSAAWRRRRGGGSLTYFPSGVPTRQAGSPND